MFTSILDKVMQFAKDWGNNTLISSLALLIIGGLLTKFFPALWRLFIQGVRWLWAKLLGQGEDQDFEKVYLDWIIGQYRHLGLLPAQVVIGRWGERQKYVDLEDIYVDLSVSSNDGVSGADVSKKGKGFWRKLRLRRGRLLTLIDENYRPGNLGAMIYNHKRLVIRGDPGSGKTTLLRYLAVTCARSLRNKRSEGDLPGLVGKRLLWSKALFPIVVILRRHGDVINWGETKELVDTFLEEMPFELRKRCPKGFFERHLQKGNCLILLDAFDELGNAEARGVMARRIAGFLQVYARLDNRILVTTRIVGYEGQLDQYDFYASTVQNLKDGEKRILIKQRYKAISVSETLGRRPDDVRVLQHNLQRRAERLIQKIESTPSLSLLATNPMLLSLIVLIHFLKIELPEERMLLYRDCVEILTEQWQKVKQEEAGLQNVAREELTLTQKLVLLRETAFAMQKQRKDEGSLALMRKDKVRDIFAERLPDFLIAELPHTPELRRAFYLQKADEWVRNLQVESGILVEQGLDTMGEPVLGFSHLTFQEYLAATALNDVEAYVPLLKQNLLNPAWREVLLLFVAITDDATPFIRMLLENPIQPDGLLLAGYCLAEHVKRVQSDVQQMTMRKLKEGFSRASAGNTAWNFGRVLGILGGSEVTSFMRQQLNNVLLLKRLVAIETLGLTRVGDPELEGVRADLLRIVEVPGEPRITVAAREALARVGDPRFINAEPIVVPIPKVSLEVITSSKSLRDWLVSHKSGFFKKTWYWYSDFLDRALYSVVVRMRYSLVRDKHLRKEYEIGKYPVTNIEYSRFIQSTGHKAPLHWLEGIFPLEESTYPVTNIKITDAVAYCEWLSLQSGRRYRLPTEWEWEWAASGPQGWRYPWGNAFDKDKCNTKESNIERITPVGSYMENRSYFGVSDMSGNVWEYTYGATLSFLVLLFPILFGVPFIILLPIFFIIAFFTHWAANIGIFVILIISLMIYVGLMCFAFNNNNLNITPKGGAFDEDDQSATCYYRGFSRGWGYDEGFRCLREITP